MSRFDHPAYGQKEEPMERPTETVTEVLVTENHRYFEVRLVVALPVFDDKNPGSALDYIMEDISDELLVLEFSEIPVHLFTVKEVNQ